jgi:hypothetical protein
MLVSREGQSGGGGAPYMSRYGGAPIALLYVLLSVYYMGGIMVLHSVTGRPVRQRRRSDVTDRIYRSAIPLP